MDSSVEFHPAYPSCNFGARSVSVSMYSLAGGGKTQVSTCVATGTTYHASAGANTLSAHVERYSTGGHASVSVLGGALKIPEDDALESEFKYSVHTYTPEINKFHPIHSCRRVALAQCRGVYCRDNPHLNCKVKFRRCTCPSCVGTHPRLCRRTKCLEQWSRCKLVRRRCQCPSICRPGSSRRIDCPSPRDD